MGLGDHRLGTALAVADLDRAREFFESKLGLTPFEDSNGAMVVYECGAGSLITVYLSPDFAGNSGGTVAAWDVENLEAEMAELESRGVKFERYDLPNLETDERGILDNGDMRIAWFRDPEGNTFAISE